MTPTYVERLERRIAELEEGMDALTKLFALFQENRDRTEEDILGVLTSQDKVNAAVNKRLANHWACLVRLARTGQLAPSLAEAMREGDSEMVAAALVTADLGAGQ